MCSAYMLGVASSYTDRDGMNGELARQLRKWLRGMRVVVRDRGALLT
jgi:hypothetical protein